MERKICIITGTRADWGLLSGIARELNVRSGVRLQIIATNMHLSPKFGNTQEEILRDGLRIDYRVPMPVENDTPAKTVAAMAGGRARSVFDVSAAEGGTCAVFTYIIMCNQGRRLTKIKKIGRQTLGCWPKFTNFAAENAKQAFHVWPNDRFLYIHYLD